MGGRAGKDNSWEVHGYTMHLNLAGWTDRHAYFLGRWHDLATRLFMFSYIRPGDLVIDVGANRGMFALVASKLVGSDGRVYVLSRTQNV